MSELLCPKCGSDKITANKKGFSGKKAIAGDLLVGDIGLLAGTIGSNKIIITCLSCGHQFKPGQQATSQADFQQKKKSNAKIGLWSGVVVAAIIVIALISRTCNKSSDKTDSNNKQNKETNVQQKTESYSFVFQIDKSALLSKPLEYLDTKVMEISIGYKNLENNSATFEEKTKFINYLKQFDKDVISDLNHQITAVGYFEYSIPTINNPKKSMSVYITSNNLKDYGKATVYQEKFNDQFTGISSKSPLYNKAKELKYGKVKFTAKLIDFDYIESQINEFKKGNATVDETLQLSIYSNYVHDRPYRAEFISFERAE